MAKYLDRISINAEEKKKAELSRLAKHAAQQLDVDILATDTKLGDTQDALDIARSATPYNAGNIIRLQRTLADLQEDLASLKKLKEEDF